MKHIGPRRTRDGAQRARLAYGARSRVARRTPGHMFDAGRAQTEMKISSDGEPPQHASLVFARPRDCTTYCATPASSVRSVKYQAQLVVTGR